MALTKLAAVAALAACCALASSARADVTAEVADLAGRIDYGFYVGDARAITDAAAALKRMSDSAAGVRYYRAFASFRLAQLGGDRAASDAENCVKSATVEEPTERLTRAAAEARARAAVESWLLVAVCSGLTAHAEPGQGARPRQTSAAGARPRARARAEQSADRADRRLARERAPGARRRLRPRRGRQKARGRGRSVRELDAARRTRRAGARPRRSRRSQSFISRAASSARRAI